MKHTLFAILAAAVLATNALAVDGVTLINQSTVMAAGGFPYAIFQPGSYKLSGNLVVPANLDGIEIFADNVTVDLNGFTILGPVTCSGQGSALRCVGSGSRDTVGIYAVRGSNFGSDNIAVLNGAVAGFSYGVLMSDGGVNCVVEEIRANGNSTTGIDVGSALVRRNAASSNGSYGIICVNSCVVLDNIADYNGLYGLYSGFFSGYSGAAGVFGSNAFDFNGTGPTLVFNAVSQGNNSCNGHAC